METVSIYQSAIRHEKGLVVGNMGYLIRFTLGTTLLKESLPGILLLQTTVGTVSQLHKKVEIFTIPPNQDILTTPVLIL